MEIQKRNRIFMSISVIFFVVVFSVCVYISNAYGFSFVDDYTVKARHVSLGMKHCYYDITMYDHTEKVVGVILPGSTYEQTFYVPESLAEYHEVAVAIRTATYDRVNTCTFTVILRQGDLESSVTVDVSDWKDNSYQTFVFDDVEWLEEGYADIVIYSSDSDEENAVTIYTTEKILFYDYMLCNGEVSYSNMCMKIYIPF